MIRIADLVDGTLADHTFGKETADGLELKVTGMSDRLSGTILVNGIPAVRRGFLFEAPVTLTQKVNEITVSTEELGGEFRQTLHVVWDKKSFKRYHFFIDDNIFFLTDIARGGYRSIFEHFYLKKLRGFHEKYGLKLTLNLFFENSHEKEPFTLRDFPDRYRGEWQDHASWLKLSFHACSEFPDRPYQNATPEKLASDYDLVREEVVRFAGEDTFTPPCNIHWAMVPPDALKVLTDRGVKVLAGQFLNAKTYVGEADWSQPTTDIGYFLDMETASYLEETGILYDVRRSLFFNQDCATCNQYTAEHLIRDLERVCHRNMINVGTHEQYSFPYYFNYIPDHFDRIEAELRFFAEHSFQSVFINEGLLGNSAWETEPADGAFLI